MKWTLKPDASGRIIIPKQLRDMLGLTPAKPVEWYINRDGQVAFRAGEGKSE
ncbi:AbrB/MazE/SpoVT family DNA-binding domain-containing protein [uncultured Sphingomonas sp.]|jgi:bifunctional DNA-binding transcriptional regulator/antitoxin component of YhaV-PrlF toxin-antitoxin module|uniref:AbrB/MazE/SpoVT family DNA-binding domain-containing protein n=1 Tax=uncultured Sphingomonas sp. TaxID=158754 RepID=UPI0030D8A6F0